MTVQVGGKIKALRARHGVTQERLAETLGITAQAVSRWESEACYPDIELLPAIADYFGVSVDDLLCVDRGKRDAKIKAYIEQAHGLQWQGVFDEPVDILRRALREFPSSFLLQAELACAIGCIDNGVKIAPALCDEAIGLCERILDDCTDDNMRLRAKAILSGIYSLQLGDMKKTREIIDSFPPSYHCRELAMAETLKILPPDPEGIENVLCGINFLLHMFGNRLAYQVHKHVGESIDALIGELKGFAQSMQKA